MARALARAMAMDLRTVITGRKITITPHIIRAHALMMGITVPGTIVGIGDANRPLTPARSIKTDAARPALRT